MGITVIAPDGTITEIPSLNQTIINENWTEFTKSITNYNYYDTLNTWLLVVVIGLLVVIIWELWDRRRLVCPKCGKRFEDPGTEELRCPRCGAMGGR